MGVYQNQCSQNIENIILLSLSSQKELSEGVSHDIPKALKKRSIYLITHRLCDLYCLEYLLFLCLVFSVYALLCKVFLCEGFVMFKACYVQVFYVQHMCYFKSKVCCVYCLSVQGLLQYLQQTQNIIESLLCLALVRPYV